MNAVRKSPNPILDEIEDYLRRVGSMIPPELIFISFRVALRKHIIERMLEKLAKRLMNHRFLQKSRLRSKRCLILTKLSDSDFFEEVKSVLSATNRAKTPNIILNVSLRQNRKRLVHLIDQKKKRR